jgi:hypothetical protein
LDASPTHVRHYFYRADDQFKLMISANSILRPGFTTHIEYKQKRLGFREQDTLAECSFSYEQAERLGIKSKGSTQCL